MNQGTGPKIHPECLQTMQNKVVYRQANQISGTNHFFEIFVFLIFFKFFDVGSIFSKNFKNLNKNIFFSKSYGSFRPKNKARQFFEACGSNLFLGFEICFTFIDFRAFSRKNLRFSTPQTGTNRSKFYVHIQNLQALRIIDVRPRNPFKNKLSDLIRKTYRKK